MRIHAVKTLALALTLGVAANGCILIPEIEDRVVELAVGHSVVVPFSSTGEINTHDDTNTINLAPNVSLDQILADNGLDAADVKDVRLAGVSYRITEAEAGRTITDGLVEFQRHPTSTPAGTVFPLVDDFSADMSVANGWITVALNSAGVAELNDLLAELLDEAKGNGAATNTWVTYHVAGVSNPAGTPTNFSYEIKLDLTIVGTLKADVVN